MNFQKYLDSIKDDLRLEERLLSFMLDKEADNSNYLIEEFLSDEDNKRFFIEVIRMIDIKRGKRPSVFIKNNKLENENMENDYGQKILLKIIYS